MAGMHMEFLNTQIAKLLESTLWTDIQLIVSI